MPVATPPTPLPPTTTPAPLPPNPSTYASAAATPPTGNHGFSFPIGFEVTPTPASGFPVPQIGASIWKNLNNTVKSSWFVKQGPKVWVRVWKARYEENHQPNVVKIQSLIGRIAGPGAAATLRVSAPVAAERLREKLPPPWHFLISNIPQGLADFLGQQVVVSTPEVTCFFLPFEPPLQTYLCTLENFALPFSAESNDIVAKLVQTTLIENHEITSFIEEHLIHPTPGAAERAIKSIYVRSLNISLSADKKKTIWNVYCQSPPDLSLSDFFSLANKVRSTEFISGDYGRGTARTGEKQFICFGCKSLDHPTGLCPFTDLPGWFGPTTKAMEAEERDLVERDRNSPRKPPQQSPMRGRYNTRGFTRGRGRR